MADGPNGVEKASAATAMIDGMEWSEEPVVQSGLTMHVLFKDPDNYGFRDAALGEARRARLYEAFSYVAETLKTSGELNVMMGPSESDGTGPLAQGGSMFVPADGITNGTVFQRLSSGTVPFPGYAEMTLTFDLGYAWHSGTDAPPPDALDLRSVALHEITHCLGFITLMAEDGSSRFAPGSSTYTVFDSLLAKNPSLKRLLGGTSTEPAFTGIPADLTGDAVVFAGASATALFEAGPPPLYSTSPFLQGTSIGHWAENSIPGGAVMEPRYEYGTARREYKDIDIAALRDIGWVNAQAPAHDPCPVQSITLDQPSPGTIAADASNSALVQFRATVILDSLDPLCGIENNALRVEYFVDGVSQGVSDDETGHFPLDLTLDAGTHTLRAGATRTDSSALPVEVEKSFSITVAPTGAGAKTGGQFNCAGGQEKPGTGTSDLLAALCATAAILLAHRRGARQQARQGKVT
jgi:hypothetical protein